MASLTYQSLYDRVKGQIQSEFFNRQLPMLLGEGDRLVFGSEIKPVQYSLTVIDVASGQVTLDGGLAQGLSRGTRFALYPFGSDFTELTSFLEFKLLDKDKQPFPDASNIVLKQNESVILRLKNTSAQSLNVAILELESTWEISQIQIQRIQSPFYELAIQEELDIPIHFVVPQREGYEQAKEVLKLFATHGVANFQWLILPSLDQQIQSRGNLNQELESKVEEMRVRGVASTINPLNSLLASIGADVNDPPQVFRKAVVKYDPNADWVTKQIQFTVKQ